MKTTKAQALGSTALAFVAALVETISNPSVAFAGGPDQSFMDRVEMHRDTKASGNTEVRDPAHLAAITGQGFDATATARDGSMIDKSQAYAEMVPGSAVLKSTAGDPGATTSLSTWDEAGGAAVFAMKSDGTMGAGSGTVEDRAHC